MNFSRLLNLLNFHQSRLIESFLCIRETSSHVVWSVLTLWSWPSTPTFTPASPTSRSTSSNASWTPTSAPPSPTCPSRPSVSAPRVGGANHPRASDRQLLLCPSPRLHHDHRLGGARRQRHRPAGLPRAPAAVLPSQPVPHVATGAGTPADQRAGPEPPLPLPT